MTRHEQFVFWLEGYLAGGDHISVVAKRDIAEKLKECRDAASQADAPLLLPQISGKAESAYQKSTTDLARRRASVVRE